MVEKGMAEAERQIRVAQRLYLATTTDAHWDRLSASARRVFIDRACQGENAEASE